MDYRGGLPLTANIVDTYTIVCRIPIPLILLAAGMVKDRHQRTLTDASPPPSPPWADLNPAEAEEIAVAQAGHHVPQAHHHEHYRLHNGEVEII